MELFSIILIAIGLSVDSFAVSVSSGLIIKRIHFFQAVRVALFLAVFQAGMPLLGWYAGLELKDIIQEYDHWIAFGLLSSLGLRMIWESVKEQEKKTTINPLKTSVLIGLSVATSIDALVIGVSFALLDIPILKPVVIIGIITFVASMLGMLLGKKLGEHFSQKIEIIGGIVLMGIGLRILIEHLFF